MLLDNKKTGRVGDALKKGLKKDARLSIISALFSIYGYDALKKELSRVESARILFSKINKNQESSLPSHFSNLLGDAFERKLRNRLDQAAIARECAAWLEDKANICVLEDSGIVGQNLYHIEAGEKTVAVHGSSNFTSSGLGFSKSNRHEMNMCQTDPVDTKSLLDWFESIWNDESQIVDAKELLLQQLKSIYQDQSPEFVYFFTLYNLFRDFIGEIEEDNIINPRTGIRETLVWNKLYRFQRDGALGAIDKLEKYNGCIIADSVGLGKTFEALAVIKYYELRNDRVLVLCPKKLRENWTIYTVNDKRNILSDDRFNYDVLNHTDLTRLNGKSGEINLETLNWGNYDLIVIDESHNFRNNNPRKDGLTRYSRMMNDIIRRGVKTKVLMLSATPVNNRMNDLKNQIAFITEGTDDAFAGYNIPSMEQTLRKAQTRFNAWLNLPDETRSVDSLLERMNFDYFKLLDLLTIARSRKHIEKYYDLTEIGRFPERLKPHNIKADIDLDDEFPPLKEINRTIRRLNLAAYAPLKYVRMDKREEYSRKYDIQVKGGSVFKQVDREQSLIHLMRVNLLKRMESSIHSFGITIGKLLGAVNLLLEKLENHVEEDIEELSIEEIEVESGEFDAFLIGNKIKVLLQDIDAIRWKAELEEDRDYLIKLLREAQVVDDSRDAKLATLQSIIETKCREPINKGNRKVIVFTAFADTAQYLYKNLADWAQDKLDIYSALVTGSGTNKTTMPGIRKDINSLITAFSPLSKERSKIDETATDEIDLLIATDCISEGQNLQDCDFLVNYDIHWNPVRIIQRFGRVDRLGSHNERIQLVNFWPNMELDEYINLEARVSGRMVLLDISATGEENIIEFDGTKMNDLEYRRKQLKQLQDTVMDLEDISGGISITDLTLNDFRMDLSEYMKEHKGLLENSEQGMFSVTIPDNLLASDEVPPGIIFCLKDVHGKVNSDTSYALAPYYFVYVGDDGDVMYNYAYTKKILDILKKQCLGRHAPVKNALAQFNAQTQHGCEMRFYQQQLEVAIRAVIGKSEEKGMESLFSRGGTTLAKDSFKGMDDFEVISYLIIMKETN